MDKNQQIKEKIKNLPCSTKETPTALMAVQNEKRPKMCKEKQMKPSAQIASFCSSTPSPSPHIISNINLLCPMMAPMIVEPGYDSTTPPLPPQPRNGQWAMRCCHLFSSILKTHFDDGMCEFIDEKSLDAKKYTSDVLDNLLLVGSIPRDILLGTEVKDLHITFNLHEFDKIHLQHLAKYHSNEKQQGRKIKCVYWQHYLDKLEEEEEESKETCDEKEENENEMRRRKMERRRNGFHKNPYIFDAGYFVEILRYSNLLQYKLSIVNPSKYGFFSVSIDTEIVHKGYDLNGAKFKFTNTVDISIHDTAAIITLSSVTDYFDVTDDDEENNIAIWFWENIIRKFSDLEIENAKLRRKVEEHTIRMIQYEAAMNFSDDSSLTSLSSLTSPSGGGCCKSAENGKQRSSKRIQARPALMSLSDIQIPNDYVPPNAAMKKPKYYSQQEVDESKEREMVVQTEDWSNKKQMLIDQIIAHQTAEKRAKLDQSSHCDLKNGQIKVKTLKEDGCKRIMRRMIMRKRKMAKKRAMGNGKEDAENEESENESNKPRMEKGDCDLKNGQIINTEDLIDESGDTEDEYKSTPGLRRMRRRRRRRKQNDQQ